MRPVTLSPPEFSKAQRALLRAELAAETATTTALLNTAAPKTLARAGLAILNLVVNNQRIGLGGKTVLELGLDPAIFGDHEEIGEHSIRTGDIVRVAPQPKGSERKKEKGDLESKGSDGVVVRRNKSGVHIAIETEADLDGRLWVVKLATEITYQRMDIVMGLLEKMDEAQYTSLIQVLFGLRKPRFPSMAKDKTEANQEKIEFHDPMLNDSQKEAIRFALSTDEVALIHGPPGKTYTLIELILQLVQRKLRVLVCGPSNISVDNIVERLAPHQISLVRLGHPARLLPSVVNHSLDVLIQTSDAAALVKDVRTELDDTLSRVRRMRNGKEKRELKSEVTSLRKEYQSREKNCVANIVGTSQVVLSTLHGSGSPQALKEKFDVVIIDEASQALEAQSWVALLNAKKVILAGDHLQLPPTIKGSDGKSSVSDKSTEKPSDTKGLSLEVTMFDRLLALYGSSVKRMLNVQYRMHETIMQFPSQELYEGKLIADKSVIGHLLSGLEYGVKDTEDTREALVFWDTQGGDFPERQESDEPETASKHSLLGDSKSNEGEAALVKMHVLKLVEAGVHPEDIAVITPYNAQLALMSKELKEQFVGIELGSVDGFQGREKEAVIVSLVRSNSNREVGFLGEKRRLNVAMTRPKRHLCIIGDSETLSQGSRFLKRWMTFLEEHADLRYPDVSQIS